MMIAMTPIDRRNWRENDGPLSRQGGRKREPLTIRQRDRDLQIAEAAETGPKPCIIGPRPIIGCQPPNGGPSGPDDGDARLPARAPSDS